MGLKARILNGKDYTKTVFVDYYGEETEVEIRPLTDGQYAAVEEITTKGMKAKTKNNVTEQELDISEINKNKRKADKIILKLGLVEELTDKEIDNLPVNVSEKLVSEILKLTGVEQTNEKKKGKGDDENLNSFRTND